MVMIDIIKELEINPIILSIFSSSYYNESITELMKNLKEKRVCYVTLNKTTDSLMKRFKSERIKTDKIFFIDAISSTIDPAEKYDNSIIISSPYALTEISIAITEALKSKAFDILVFDSLSSLNMYNYAPNTAGQFTSFIINKIKSKKNMGVFTCLENDEKTELIKESSMFVDKVVRFRSAEREKQKSILTYTFALLLLGLFSVFLAKPKIIGMVTTALDEIPDVNPYVPLVLAGIFFLVAIIVYKKPFLSGKEEVLPPEKPEPKNVKETIKLKEGFKAKIKRWLRRTK
jgi:hypothetical protein